MPIYEFHCGKCDRDSELLVRSMEWKGTKCPHCGSSKLQKKLSVFASSMASSGGGEAPACGMNPTSCGMGGGCCGGGPHRH